MEAKNQGMASDPGQPTRQRRKRLTDQERKKPRKPLTYDKAIAQQTVKTSPLNLTASKVLFSHWHFANPVIDPCNGLRHNHLYLLFINRNNPEHDLVISIQP